MFSVLIKPFDASVDPPEDLLCPITLSLFQDPVVCEDGFTYERRAIVDWVQHRGTSPMTNLRLSQTFLPNHNVKSRASAWKERQESPLEMPLSFQERDGTYNVKNHELERFRLIIHQSLHHLSSQYEVIRIERNVSRTLWNQYATLRKSFVDNGTPTHEAYAFHGCSTIADMDSILQRNFDPSLSKGGPCGRGIYLSSAIVYPIQTEKLMWTDKNKTQCKIIAARVILGQCVMGNDTLFKAPTGAHSTYTMALGGYAFCVYNARQVYPELVIHLKKTDVRATDNGLEWKKYAAIALTEANAIQKHLGSLNNPLIEFFESPDHPCVFLPPEDQSNSQSGTIIGRGKNDEIAVYVEQEEEEEEENTRSRDKSKIIYVPRAQVFPNENVPISFPWKKSGICFTAEDRSAPLMQILGKDIEGLTAKKPGLKTTFLSIFSVYRRYGIAMFFIGGAIRHALTKQFNGINDIDVTYGQHPSMMKDIADEVGFGPVEIVGGIKTQWGTGKFIMEGNPIQSWVVKWTGSFTEIQAQSCVVSNDIIRNLISVDFTCNSIMFDPLQNIFIDPSGYGLYDIQNKLLRATVPQQEWDLWYSQNRRKPFRYWKMRMLQYRAASDELRYFLCRKTVESVEDPAGGGAEKLLNVICKVAKHRQKILPAFKTLFFDEMTHAETVNAIEPGTTVRVWKMIIDAYNLNH